MFRLLLNAGVDVDIHGRDDTPTALIYASMRGNLDITVALYEF